jgi:ABC-type transport system involved in multi-copper enzyme maturation permease subunit
MTGVLAILTDSLRELRARKLFWFALGISALLVLLYGSIGFDETGVTWLFGLTHFDSEAFNTETGYGAALLEGLFSGLMVGVWLSLGAIVLALLSTAGTFPTFLEDGAIDLVLSKPLSRVTIFLARYAGSMLFVLLQVTVFCGGVFLVLGLRLGAWRWSLFLVIPVILAVYAYLSSVTVLVGVITRSTMAALITTALVWFVIFGLQTTEVLINQLQVVDQARLSGCTQRYRYFLDRIDGSTREARQEHYRDLAEEALEQATRAREGLVGKQVWLGRVNLVLSFLPKTQQTTRLATRWLDIDAETSMQEVFLARRPPDEEAGDEDRTGYTRRQLEDEVRSRMEEDYGSRSALATMGTSLAFTAVLVLIALLVFLRRDY